MKTPGKPLKSDHLSEGLDKKKKKGQNSFDELEDELDFDGFENFDELSDFDEDDDDDF